MFKVSNNVSPSNITNMFHKRDPVNETVPILRSTTSNNFILPKPKTELFKNSLSFTGPMIWNCLPENVKLSSSIASFHRNCVMFMVNSNTVCQ